VNIRSKKMWAGTLATSAVAALGLTLVTTSSAPAKGPVPAPAKIKMVFDGNGPPHFEGADAVAAGQDLKIVNTSKPKEIGPHTFSLVEESSLPNSRQEMKQCARLELPVCLNVFKAHDISNKFVVKKPNVDKGLEGWDRSFSDEVKGDTWFSDEKGSSETRTVSAEAGSTLYYFCIVHPEMQGAIGVTSR
jgi:plastocyanin